MLQSKKQKKNHADRNNYRKKFQNLELEPDQPIIENFQEIAQKKLYKAETI